MHKQSRISSSRKYGFSLVELMVVLSIISIVAGLAIPKFKTFQARTKQTEAKVHLKFIHTLQSAYFSENDSYSPPEANTTSYNAGGKYFDNLNGDPVTSCNVISSNYLGFKFTDCTKIRYNYFIRVLNDGNQWIAGASSARITYIDESQSFNKDILGVLELAGNTIANNSVFPGCEIHDNWLNSEKNELQNVGDLISDEDDELELKNALNSCY